MIAGERAGVRKFLRQRPDQRDLLSLRANETHRYGAKPGHNDSARFFPDFCVSENSVHAIGEAKSSSDRASEHTCAMRFTDPQPRYDADFMAYCIREHVS